MPPSRKPLFPGECASGSSHLHRSLITQGPQRLHCVAPGLSLQRSLNNQTGLIGRGDARCPGGGVTRAWGRPQVRRAIVGRCCCSVGAERAGQPAGPGKLLFTVSELLKEALPRSSAAFRTSAWTMGVLVTVVSFFFLGAQAQNEWTYSGKRPPSISRQGDKTAHPCWLWVLLFWVHKRFALSDEQIDFQPR